MDELEMEILRMLRKDCRLSSREIARQLNISTGAVQHRIRNLEAQGIIEGYHAKLDFSKLNYGISAMIAVMTKGEELQKRLAEQPNVVSIYDITGEYDLLIAAKFRSIEELDDFIKGNLYGPLVEKIVTFLVLKTIKEGHTLLG